METIEYNTGAGVVPYATIQNLAAGTAGPGRLAHWHIAASGDATAISNSPVWLEYATSIVHDGVNFGAGGTEDFFGCQYYGTEFQPKGERSRGLGPTQLPTQKIGMQVVWYTAS